MIYLCQGKFSHAMMLTTKFLLPSRGNLRGIKGQPLEREKREARISESLRFILIPFLSLQGKAVVQEIPLRDSTLGIDAWFPFYVFAQSTYQIARCPFSLSFRDFHTAIFAPSTKLLCAVDNRSSKTSFSNVFS